MGRKGAASSSVSAVSSRRPPVLPRLRWPFDLKRTALIAVVLALAGIVVFAATRERTAASRPAASAAVSRPAAPPRPAWTSAEEAYIRTLWPIHGAVERSAARLALGQIFYKNKDLDRKALKARVDEAMAAYRRSEAALLGLAPPSSLAREHEEYLAAVRLFQQSTAEILKMFADGRDEHMMTAYPIGQKATDKIREVGLKLWPGEFPAN
jgi:hypothetical protein